MKCTYDKQADAVYIRFEEQGGTLVSSTEGGPFLIDLSDKGEVLGIEVLSASKILHKSFLESCEQL